MKFLIDSMLPPGVAGLLEAVGYDAITPTDLGAHNLPDDVVVELAAAEGRVIVTENASDFSAVSACPVLLILKSWWPVESLASALAAAIDRWAKTNPDPGAWPHWLAPEVR